MKKKVASYVKKHEAKPGDARRSFKRAEMGQPMQEIKINAPIPKRLRNMSVDDALGGCSALPPTRLALLVDYGQFVSFVRTISTFTAYHMQQKGIVLSFDSDDAAGVNPSKIMAYYLAISAMHFLKVGAVVSTSSQVVSVEQYVVPAFFGKWLQQLSPSKHFGRIVCLTFGSDITVSTFFDEVCGNGGLAAYGDVMPAPCFTPGSAAETEPWFSVAGQLSEPAITVNSISAKFNYISEAISRCFKHKLSVADIPKTAANCELKATPIAETLPGQFMFSVVDANVMCDLLLPLSGFLYPSLVNSPGPVQLASPVRVDSGLASCIPAKIAFLFWLANRHPFVPGDSFLTYLRKYGFKDKHLGNIQVNLRQINWVGVIQSCISYCETVTPTTPGNTWNFIQYVVGLVNSALPAVFRAFNPLQQHWGVSRCFKEIVPFCNYGTSVKGSKVPPFLAEIISAISKPTRTANAITMFISMMPSPTLFSGTPAPAWYTASVVQAPTFGSLADYESEPITMENCGVAILGGTFSPYPSYKTTNTPPSAYPDAVRNEFVLNGYSSSVALFQRVFLNNQIPVVNSWMSKHPRFTSRLGCYYLPCQLGQQKLVVINGQVSLSAGILKPKEIVAWEPTGYHSAIVATVNLITYFMPTDAEGVLAPIFSAVPNSTSAVPVAVSHSGSYLGQGTSVAIKAGTSSDPASIASHAGAEANEGVVQDASTPPPEHLTKQVMKGVKDIVGSDAGEKIEKGVEKTASIVSKTIDMFTNII